MGHALHALSDLLLRQQYLHRIRSPTPLPQENESGDGRMAMRTF
jgi:hypothetical protein